jgi:hypothetical protein
MHNHELSVRWKLKCALCYHSAGNTNIYIEISMAVSFLIKWNELDETFIVDKDHTFEIIKLRILRRGFSKTNCKWKLQF